MIGRRAVALTLACLCLVACKDDSNAGETVFNLPAGLKEASGLAVAGPDSVFTHDDEHAIVYEVALANGHIARAFAFGKPTLEGDFEGIATAAGRVFLVTSDGLIYAARPGLNGERVDYKVYDSGVGAHCEIEGLSEAPIPDALLILCKRRREKADNDKVEIFLWKIGEARAGDEPWLAIPKKALLAKGDRAEFRPSGLEWDPATGHLLIVAARDGMLLEIDPQGHLIKARKLNHTRHPKTEGIAVMPDGRLVLADEGSKVRPGTVAVFRENPSN